MQACHKDLRSLSTLVTAQLEGMPEQSAQHASALQSVKEQVTDMSKSLKQLKHDVVAVNADTQVLAQRMTGVEGILGSLMPKVNTLSGQVTTMSTNLDTIRQTTEGHWKDQVSKMIAALANNLKANHAHWEQTTEKNHQYLVDGVKEVLKKVTACDYDSYTGTTQQLEEMGQELLQPWASCRPRACTTWRRLLQTRLSKYCERPPVPLQHHDRAPPPPSYEAPSVIHECRQLPLQSAIPQPQGNPRMFVELGAGRRVNIPLFR